MAILWRLRAVLDARHITRMELARRLGVEHPSIYRLAAASRITRITTAKLDAICEAVDCEPGDLLVRETAKPAKRAKAKPRRR
jgi:putative transcriptional regulator